MLINLLPEKISRDYKDLLFISAGRRKKRENPGLKVENSAFYLSLSFWL